MEKIDKYRTYILAGLLVIGLSLLAVFGPEPAPDTGAQAAASDTKKKMVAAATDTKQQKPASSYTYVAQPGDSYSLLARKAIQTFGLVNNVKLTQAQILAAEATLTTNAGSPLLNEGQTVSFDTTRIKSAVEASQKLSADSLASWQEYVASVDFNTNAAGQNR